MIDDLFQHIINKILAMPKLALSPASQKEFLQRCERITFDKTLTPETFLQDLAQYPETKLWYREKRALENYLALMNDIINDIDFFIRLLNYTGHEKLGSPIDADTLFPLVSRLLPNDAMTLQQLQKTIEYLSDVNVRYRYFFDINGIVNWKLEQDPQYSPSNAEPASPDDKAEKKIGILLDSLRDHGFYSQSFLMVKICELCMKRMRECYDSVFYSLHTNHIHEFDINLMYPTNYEIMQAERDSMRNLYAAKDHAFLVAHPEIWKTIKKYVAYEEFYNSIGKINTRVFNRLVEFTYKYLNFETDLENDLDEVFISVPENVRKYFYPDKSYAASIVTLSFLWSTAYDTNISLRNFMEAFIKKIQMLENEADATDTQSVTRASTLA